MFAGPGGDFGSNTSKVAVLSSPSCGLDSLRVGGSSSPEPSERSRRSSLANKVEN